MKIQINIQKRVPTNMVWDRIQLEKKQAHNLALLNSKNKKSNADLAFVPEPHSQ